MAVNEEMDWEKLRSIISNNNKVLTNDIDNMLLRSFSKITEDNYATREMLLKIIDIQKQMIETNRKIIDNLNEIKDMYTRYQKESALELTDIKNKIINKTNIWLLVINALYMMANIVVTIIHYLK